MPPTNEEHTAAEGAPVPIPGDALIIIPVRNTVLFPGMVAPIAIERAKSIAAAQQALREQRPVGILLQRNVDVDDPGPDDLHRLCTVANIVRYITAADETHHIICQGVQRARILDFLPGTPFPAARVAQIPEPTTSSPEIEARFLNLQRQAVEAIQLLPQAPPELVALFQSTTSPATLADLATAYGHQAAGQAGDPGNHRSRAANGEGFALSRRTARSASPDARDRPADPGHVRRTPARGDSS